MAPVARDEMNLVAITLLFVATLVAVLVWRRPRSTAAIVDATGAPLPNSVATLEQVMLGGVAQGLLVRGDNLSNPVLL
jgi:hypothetical protein